MKKPVEVKEEVKKEELPGLPRAIKVIGVYKLKDKERRNVISFKVMPDMEGVIIQKITGSNNKIIVAVKLFDAPVKLEEANKNKKEIKENDKPKEEIKS